MKELVFVGLGLHDEKGISLKGIEETKTADQVFMELYTNLMLGFSTRNFAEITGRQVSILTRHDLEEENGKLVLDAADNGKVVFLVPGDPFIATTHVALRIEAEKRGIRTRIVHGSSIISAIMGLSGLHNYKFGKTVTIPFAENFSETPYRVIAQNMTLGLHTLCLLDIAADQERFLCINEALSMLLEVEQKNKLGIATQETLAVGVARAGSDTPLLRAGSIKQVMACDFGGSPQSLILPGDLHFMEAEALIAFAKAPLSLRSAVR